MLLDCYRDLDRRSLDPFKRPEAWTHHDPDRIRVKMIGEIQYSGGVAYEDPLNPGEGYYLWKKVSGWVYHQSQDFVPYAHSTRVVGMVECRINLRFRGRTRTYRTPEAALKAYPNSGVIQTLNQYDLWHPSLDLVKVLGARWNFLLNSDL